MALPGSRIKVIEFWLLPSDEAVVADRINEVFPDSGWLCSQPGPIGLHKVHLHCQLEEAMGCGGDQAFIPLPVGAALDSAIELACGLESRSNTPQLAILQFLRSRIHQDAIGEYFGSGRLAVRWFEPEVGPNMHAELTEQVRLIWAALRAATKPAAVITEQGRRTTGVRIGPAARQLVTERGLPLTLGGRVRLRLE